MLTEVNKDLRMSYADYTLHLTVYLQVNEIFMFLQE